MKKRFISLCAVGLVFSMLLTGCSSGTTGGTSSAATSSGESQTSEQTSAEPVRLSIGGTNQSGTGYIVSSGAAKLIDQYVDNVYATVEATSGSVENVKLINSNECQMGVTMADTANYGYNGIAPLDAKYENIRLMLQGNPSVMHFVVAADSDIKTIADLKGKRVGVGAPGSSSASIMTPAILAAYGLSYDDIDEQEIGQSECSTALSDKTIDCGIFYTAYPASAISELSTSKEVRILPMEQDVFDKLKEEYPFFEAVTIPGNTYKGMADDALVVGVATIMMVNKDVPEDVVYQIVKALDEHKDEWKAIHSAAAYYTVERTAEIGDGIIPLHPGTLKYLKEKGLA